MVSSGKWDILYSFSDSAEGSFVFALVCLISSSCILLGSCRVGSSSLSESNNSQSSELLLGSKIYSYAWSIPIFLFIMPTKGRETNLYNT